VGTDKRERQKLNRQQKLEELAREARKRKTKRRALQIGLGIPVLILLVFGLVYLFGSDDNKPATTSSTSTTAAPTTTLPGATGDGTVCPNTDGSSARTTQFTAAPVMCIDVTKKYAVTVNTNLGSYTAELDPSIAPKTVNNFVFLALYHYFDGTPCHRIINNFVIQCGDPTGSGTGGPGYTFDDELPAAGQYKVGSLAMANSGPNTNGSQFFVITGDQGVRLDPNYSLFGQVTQGLDVVEAINAVGSKDTSGTASTPVSISSVLVSVVGDSSATSTPADGSSDLPTTTVTATTAATPTSATATTAGSATTAASATSGAATSSTTGAASTTQP
jgi:cyclophilin family peptidyl-prolyl cis-trans isomerase